MGKLLLFPVLPIQSRISAETAKMEIVAEKYDAVTNEVATALELLNQMAVKVEQLQSLLPSRFKSDFGKRRGWLLGQIDLARSKTASLTHYSNRPMEN
jgi:hypothetical protein